MNSIRIHSFTKLLGLVTLLFCYPILWTNGIVGNFGDIYEYAAPFRFFAKTNLQAGNFPLWNPEIFAGTPFLASPQSALFYPLTQIFHFLPLPIAFNFFTVLHLLLNAFGMFLLLTYLKRSISASIVGSLVWAFSFFFLSKIAAGHIIHLSGYSWCPIVLLLAIRCLHRSKPSSQPFDMMSFPFWCLVISFIVQFFSGHLQVWFHTALLLILIFCWKLALHAKSDGKFYCYFAGHSLVAFACVSLIQSFPTWIYMLQSTRHKAIELFHEQSVYEFATSYSMNPKALIALFIPNFFGNPIQKTFIDPQHPSIYFESYALYFGILSVLMALAGLYISIKNKKWFLPFIVLLFILMALGKHSPLYNLLWSHLSFLRVPARFYFLAFAGLVLGFTIFWDSFIKNRSPQLKFGFFILIFFDLFINGRQFIWSEDYRSRINRSEAMIWFQTQNKMDNNSFRIFSAAHIGQPNKVMFFGIHNMNGYEAILQKSLLRFFASTQGEQTISTTGVDFQNPNYKSFQLLSVKYLVTVSPRDMEWPVRTKLNELTIYENPHETFPARAIFSLRSVPNYKSLFSLMDSKDFDYKNEMIQVGTNPHKRLQKKEIRLDRFERPSPNRIHMVWKGQTHANFWVFLSEAYYPGWEAWTESGMKIKPFKSNGYFQGAFVNDFSPPSHKIFWIYRPKEYRLGATVTILSILILLGVCTIQLRQKMISL